MQIICEWSPDNEYPVATQMRNIHEELCIEITSSVWRIKFGSIRKSVFILKKRLLSPTLENHKHPIDSHCKKFDSLILNCHIWNIPKKYPSRIFTACRSNLYTSWECLMCNNSELSCQNFTMGVNGVFIIFQCWRQETFLNKYWFANRSKFNPLPCHLVSQNSITQWFVLFRIPTPLNIDFESWSLKSIWYYINHELFLVTRD